VRPARLAERQAGLHAAPAGAHGSALVLRLSPVNLGSGFAGDEVLPGPEGTRPVSPDREPDNPDKSMRERVREYLERTRRSIYTLALVAPFLAIYEVGILALRLSHEQFRTRNGADAIIRSVLFPLGIQSAGPFGAFMWSILSALVLVACWFIWRRRERASAAGRIVRFRPGYVAWLFAESAGWAMVLFVASVAFFRAELRSEGSRAASIAVQVVLNSGAGVYEELVFRVILVLVLALLFTKIVHLERVPGGIAAAVAAAIIFSLVHFSGPAGAAQWNGPHFWPLFVFRAAAGLGFSLLFYFRSFGVAVATHALYDSIVTAVTVLG